MCVCVCAFPCREVELSFLKSITMRVQKRKRQKKNEEEKHEIAFIQILIFLNKPMFDIEQRKKTNFSCSNKISKIDITNSIYWWAQVGRLSETFSL